MKNLLVFLVCLCGSSISFCQAPQALNYQAIARKADGSILAAQSIFVRFSILDGSATGTRIYQETHETATNNFGLFTLSIGKGNAVTGQFSAIPWGSRTKFLQVEIAFQRGGNYLLQGVTQLLSVPYALYAESSGTSGTPGPIGATGQQGPIGPQGPTGSAGPAGATGQQGPIGPQGPTGPVGPRGAKGDAGMQGPSGNNGATGPQGPIGPAGPQGIQGPVGAAGAPGAKGSDGKTVLNGIIDPSAGLGVEGDFYLNTTTLQLYGPKTTGGWGAGASLRGGPQGPPGLKSLIALESFSGNATCTTGGVTVKSGIDRNSNNVLDAGEVDNTKSICFSQSSPDAPKIFAARIQQSGQNPPVTAAVGTNSLNLSITWSRLSQGHFKGILNQQLNSAKTILLSNSSSAQCSINSKNEILIDNVTGVNAWSDDFYNLTLEIRVYP